MITIDVKKATKDILEAYNRGGVAAAADAYHPYAAFRELVMKDLTGKIPYMLLERICFKPRRTGSRGGY